VAATVLGLGVPVVTTALSLVAHVSCLRWTMRRTENRISAVKRARGLLPS